MPAQHAVVVFAASRFQISPKGMIAYALQARRDRARLIEQTLVTNGACMTASALCFLLVAIGHSTMWVLRVSALQDAGRQQFDPPRIKRRQAFALLIE